MVDKSGWIALSYSLGYFLLVSVAVFAMILAWKWRARILKNQESFITARGQVQQSQPGSRQGAAVAGAQRRDAAFTATVWWHTAKLRRRARPRAAIHPDHLAALPTLLSLDSSRR